MGKISEFEKQTLNFQKKIVREALSLCTDKQQLFFKKLYPEGIESLNSDKLKNAYDQCKATIKKNLKQSNGQSPEAKRN